MSGRPRPPPAAPSPFAPQAPSAVFPRRREHRARTKRVAKLVAASPPRCAGALRLEGDRASGPQGEHHRGGSEGEGSCLRCAIRAPPHPPPLGSDPQAAQHGTTGASGVLARGMSRHHAPRGVLDWPWRPALLQGRLDSVATGPTSLSALCHTGPWAQYPVGPEVHYLTGSLAHGPIGPRTSIYYRVIRLISGWLGW